MHSINGSHSYLVERWLVLLFALLTSSSFGLSCSCSRYCRRWLLGCRLLGFGRHLLEATLRTTKAKDSGLRPQYKEQGKHNIGDCKHLTCHQDVQQSSCLQCTCLLAATLLVSTGYFAPQQLATLQTSAADSVAALQPHLDRCSSNCITTVIGPWSTSQGRSGKKITL